MAALPQSLPHRPVASSSSVCLRPYGILSPSVCVHIKSLFLQRLKSLDQPTLTHCDLILLSLSAKTLLPNKVTFTGPGDSDLNTSSTSVSPAPPNPQGHQPRIVKERPSLAQGGWRRPWLSQAGRPCEVMGWGTPIPLLCVGVLGPFAMLLCIATSGTERLSPTSPCWFAS